ncbi:hypothetical protein [Burkholderia ubonensis]|uniref:Uncharacterized protein n=2 Tax=Burkholderia ubonensis TaxID=101571 RepID=A0A1R1JGH1_9BURK|nr:hypothetical protein [Burkholderia ubonensis]OMG74444.1 hypothetical protein BW685_04655 [Burkholderia ubonensis]
MDEPFDGDVADEADTTDETDAFERFDEQSADASFGDESFDESGDFAVEAQEGDAGADLADEMDDVDDMALWNAFEEELADGLDAADDDEFIGRLLGGIGRAAGVVGRGLGRAAGVAGQVGALAQRTGDVAGRIGSVADAVSPAAIALARLARVAGSPAAADALGRAGHVARRVGRAARQTRRAAGSLGQAAGGVQGLFGQISQLLSRSAGADDAFDALADLYVDDGVDEALPAMIGLAARAAIRGLGFRNAAQLSAAARRALVRGVAAAARELARSRSPHAVRALPRLTHSAAAAAQRQLPTPQQAVRLVRRELPRAARQLAQNPRLIRSAVQPGAPRPLVCPEDMGHGLRSARIGRSRSFHIDGPVTLTITSH